MPRGSQISFQASEIEYDSEDGEGETELPSVTAIDTTHYPSVRDLQEKSQRRDLPDTEASLAASSSTPSPILHTRPTIGSTSEKEASDLRRYWDEFVTAYITSEEILEGSFSLVKKYAYHREALRNILLVVLETYSLPQHAQLSEISEALSTAETEFKQSEERMLNNQCTISNLFKQMGCGAEDVFHKLSKSGILKDLEASRFSSEMPETISEVATVRQDTQIQHLTEQERNEHLNSWLAETHEFDGDVSPADANFQPSGYLDSLLEGDAQPAPSIYTPTVNPDQAYGDPEPLVEGTAGTVEDPGPNVSQSKFQAPEVPEPAPIPSFATEDTDDMHSQNHSKHQTIPVTEPAPGSKRPRQPKGHGKRRKL